MDYSGSTFQHEQRVECYLDDILRAIRGQPLRDGRPAREPTLAALERPAPRETTWQAWAFHQCDQEPRHVWVKLTDPCPLCRAERAEAQLARLRAVCNAMDGALRNGLDIRQHGDPGEVPDAWELKEWDRIKTEFCEAAAARGTERAPNERSEG